MNDVKTLRGEEAREDDRPIGRYYKKVASDLCEMALQHAKTQLHPLLQNLEFDRLDKRGEFLQAFKNSLEQSVARTLAAWQPSIQAVFKFDETPVQSWETWDGSIHLLAKVPRLSDALKSLGRKLDRSLVKYLTQLDWSRFQECQSILEVQQVTPNELRRGVSYGAMFSAVYSAPVKVWPQDKSHSG